MTPRRYYVRDRYSQQTPHRIGVIENVFYRPFEWAALVHVSIYFD